MKIDYLEYRKAFSSSRRRQTFKSDGVTTHQEAGCLSWLYRKTSRGVNANLVKAGVDGMGSTADWTFDGSRHRIRVSEDLAEAVLGEKGSDSAIARLNVVKAAFTHESCHGAYTDVNVHATAVKCAEEKVPFRLLNLFEDCRIEAAYVAERGKKFKFGWQRLLECNTPSEVNDPAHLLLLIKQREPLTVLKSVTPSSVTRGYVTWTGTPKVTDAAGRNRGVVEVVLDFYLRAVKAAATNDLIPIIKEWVKVFGYNAGSLPPILIKVVEGTLAGKGDPHNPDPGSTVAVLDPTAKPSTEPAPDMERPSISEDRVFYGDVTIDFTKRTGNFIPLSRFTLA